VVGDIFDVESHCPDMISAFHPFLRVREYPVHEIAVTEDAFIRLPEEVVAAHRQDVRPPAAATDKTSSYKVIPPARGCPFFHKATIPGPGKGCLVSEEAEYFADVLP